MPLCWRLREESSISELVGRINKLDRGKELPDDQTVAIAHMLFARLSEYRAANLRAQRDEVYVNSTSRCSETVTLLPCQRLCQVGAIFTAQLTSNHASSAGSKGNAPKAMQLFTSKVRVELGRSICIEHVGAREWISTMFPSRPAGTVMDPPSWISQSLCGIERLRCTWTKLTAGLHV
jgi:hypothetical protein